MKSLRMFSKLWVKDVLPPGSVTDFAGTEAPTAFNTPLVWSHIFWASAGSSINWQVFQDEGNTRNLGSTDNGRDTITVVRLL